MYTPLTLEQFQKAKQVGFTPDKIIDMEKKRKIQESVGTPYTEQPIKPQQNYPQRVGEQYQNIGSRLTSSLQKTGDEYLQKAKTGNILGASGSLLRGGLRAVGAVAEGAFAPIFQAPIIKPITEKIGQKIGETSVGKKVGELAQKYPEQSQDVMDVANIFALGGGKAVETLFGKKASLKNVLPNIVEKPLVGAGKALQGAGEKLYKIGVPLQERTKIAQQLYEASKPTLWERAGGLFGAEQRSILTKPITEAQTAARQGLMGTQWKLGVRAKTASDKLWKNNIEPALVANKEKINIKEFLNDIGDKIIAETPDLSRRKALTKALNAIKGDFKKVNSVSLRKLQDYKVDWAKFVPERAYKGEPISGALNDVRNTLAQNARAKIYNTVGGDIKQAYIDYGNLQSIAELGRKSTDQLRAKGITKQAWELILDTGIVPVSTVGGQVLYRTGQGLEFIGKEGGKTLRDILGGTAPAGLSIQDVSNQPLIKESTANISTKMTNPIKNSIPPTLPQPPPKSNLPKVLNGIKSNISKDLEPLAQEARKYKSAEEFVKIKHGAEPIAAIPGEPISFLGTKRDNFGTAQAKIIFDEAPDQSPLGYRIELKNGQPLANPNSTKMGGSPYFDTLSEAEKYAQSQLTDFYNKVKSATMKQKSPLLPKKLK